ncbi:hypothetical protein BIV59_02180 [Bacillus sp. MUM 13]|nr:hypothetical protein BIV59_02180 [Bacillus sp. MUM 13]
MQAFFAYYGFSNYFLFHKNGKFHNSGKFFTLIFSGIAETPFTDGLFVSIFRYAKVGMKLASYNSVIL